MRTINMIRDRSDLPKLVERLIVIVADHIIPEEMLRKPDMKDLSSFWAWVTAAVAANYLMDDSHAAIKVMRKDGCCWQ